MAADPAAFDETTVELVHALADYGHHAQPYLSDVRGWKLGDDHAVMAGNAELTADAIADARGRIAAFAPDADIPAGSEVQAVTMDLDLVTNTTVCLNVAVKDGARLASAALADGTELEVLEMSDGRWAVRIPGIMAHHLADTLDVVVTTSGGTTATVHVSALSFGQVMLVNEKYKNEGNGQRLAAALYRYWQAADAYMQAHPSN